MWYDLYIKQRQRYQKLITDFASLGKIFTNQMPESVVNLDYMKRCFQNSFQANPNGNKTPAYDFTIDHSENKNHTKYLIAVRDLSTASPYHLLDTFENISLREWQPLVDKLDTQAKVKSDGDQALMKKLIHNVCTVWNERVHSYQESLRGFKNDDVVIEACYHTLRSKINYSQTQIEMGETPFPIINLNQIEKVNLIPMQNSNYLQFSDGKSSFMYSTGDAMLRLNFIPNDKGGVKQWPVSYTDHPINQIIEMGQRLVNKNEPPIDSHSWYLDVRPYSGLNAFYGKSKLSRAPGYRENRINKFCKDFADRLDGQVLKQLKTYLEKILLNDWRSDDDKKRMVTVRSEMMQLVFKQHNDELKKAIVKMVYRPASEIEFRIPNSKQFHRLYPHFFVDDIIYKFSEDRKARTFKIRFVPSNDEVDAYVGQDTGKAINFWNLQEKLGNWILQRIFQLNAYEPLTEKRMTELKINGIRFIKRKNTIDFEFIWIDKGHEPNDLWRQVDHDVESLF